MEKTQAELNPPVIPTVDERVDGSEEELKLEVATQWQLMWWKFRKHRLAMVGAIVVIAFYLIAIFANFLAPRSIDFYNAKYSNYAPPQQLHFIHDGQFGMYVFADTFKRDPQSFQPIWSIDEKTIIPVGFFVH